MICTLLEGLCPVCALKTTEAPNAVLGLQGAHLNTYTAFRDVLAFQCTFSSLCVPVLTKILVTILFPFF